MERVVIEYLANAFWQLPLLATGAWLLIKMWKPGPAAQHRVWIAVLALGLLLPLRGAAPVTTESPATGAALRLASFSHFDSPQRAQSASVGEITSAATPGTADFRSAQEAGKTWADFAAALFPAHRVSVSSVVAQWILGLWLAFAFWGLLRVALAWRAARKLVANSREATLVDREHDALLACARQVGVVAPEVRESNAIAGPVIVGAAKPVLLWPENLSWTSGDELRAALCHELAHIRRWDYGMNLLCEIAALPIKWHPATHRIERRIRATREMACDALAAEAMDSETIYAECLVRLARSIVGDGAMQGSLAAGLFNGNVMEERVMRLMRGRTAMSWRARVVRVAAGAAAMAAAIALAGAFHVSPAMAQEPAVVPSVKPPSAQTSDPAVAAIPPARTKTVVAVPSTPAETPAVPPAPSSEPKPIVLPQVPAQPAQAPVVDQPSPSTITNGQAQHLTPSQRARIEKQLAEAQKKIAEATAKINSPEFQRQIEEAQRKALQAETMLNSPEFKLKMAEAQKQIAEATAKVNSPEFRKKIQAEIDAAAKVNSAEFQKQIGDAQAAALRAQTMINSAEFQKTMAEAQKQVAEATARLNSPEFRKQIEEAARAAAKVNSAEFQKQMAEAQKQVADAMAKMKAEQEKDAAK